MLDQPQPHIEREVASRIAKLIPTDPRNIIVSEKSGETFLYFINGISKNFNVDRFTDNLCLKDLANSYEGTVVLPFVQPIDNDKYGLLKNLPYQDSQEQPTIDSQSILESAELNHSAPCVVIHASIQAILKRLPPIGPTVSKSEPNN